jgi:hypothetical protein
MGGAKGLGLLHPSLQIPSQRRKSGKERSLTHLGIKAVPLEGGAPLDSARWVAYS